MVETGTLMLDTMRHSCAHVMAAAISEIWPQAQFGVGPTTSNGFYYDVLFPKPIGQEDLTQIERTMKAIQRKIVCLLSLLCVRLMKR